MTKHKIPKAGKAAIYCRVSSVRQTKVGDGLGSQETRCREYARARGYEVVGTYADDISGSALNRRGMKELLGYLVANTNNSEKIVVIIDDISRLARNIDTHSQLRQAIASAGGMLESPSIEFGDDSDSRLIEYLLATVAEHQRGKNGEVKLNGKAKVPARANLNEEFPLRNFVVCADCASPLTSCWSKSRTGDRHPYYLCFKPGCAQKGKSIRRAEIEGAFAELLRSMRPTQTLTQIASAMFRELWDHRQATENDRRSQLKTHAAKIQRDIDKVVDLMIETESDTARSAYEKRLHKLELEKALTAERLGNCVRPARGFDQTLRTALEFLASPWKLWESSQYADKRLCLKLTFADKLAYVRGEGFRTANLTLPFKVLADFLSPEVEMARPKRFELLTS